MAIAFDATSTIEQSSNTPTLSHTCAANASLFVAIWTTAAPILVQYNSVNMTQLSSLSVNGQNQYLYYLGNASAGANNVFILFGGTNDTRIIASSYTGMQSSATPDKTTSASSGPPSSGSITTTLTTVADNCWTILLGVCTVNSGDCALAASTGSTSRSIQTYGGSTSMKIGIFDSNGVVHPAGSKSMSLTSTTNTGSILSGYMVSMAPGTLVNANFLPLL